MLADSSDTPAQSGHLSPDVHRPGAFLHRLLDFVAAELPAWRDDPDRPRNIGETALTEHLADYLTSKARRSVGWDIVQFRTEAADERNRGRRVDLAPKPCSANIWIDGRRHTHYQSLLPIECKRLPTPKEKGRDEREYVTSRNSTTGGIQRFKEGHHGAEHKMGAMIAYVQAEAPSVWQKRISGWINDLVKAAQPGWTAADLLNLERELVAEGMALYRSSHARRQGLPNIELRHLWLKMN